MFTEFVEGFVVRPMMDAGYTAWKDGERVGIAHLEDGEVVVDAHDPFVARVLRERLESDLRAAGLLRPASGRRSAA